MELLPSLSPPLPFPPARKSNLPGDVIDLLGRVTVLGMSFLSPVRSKQCNGFVRAADHWGVSYLHVVFIDYWACQPDLQVFMQLVGSGCSKLIFIIWFSLAGEWLDFKKNVSSVLFSLTVSEVLILILIWLFHGWGKNVDIEMYFPWCLTHYSELNKHFLCLYPSFFPFSLAVLYVHVY